MFYKRSFLVIFLIGLIFFGAKPSFAATLKVAVTIPPLSDIARQIGAEDVDVITILPVNSDPHVFELNTKLMKSLNGVQAVFLIGHGLDDWSAKIADVDPNVQMIAVDKNISFLDPAHPNPHYWLSVKNAKLIAKNIAQSLTEMDPASQKRFTERLERYLLALDELDQLIKQFFLDVSNKKMITFHDSWGYFAQDYGFQVLGTVEGCEDLGPKPKGLVGLAAITKKEGIKVLFSEPAIPKELSDPIAKDLGVNVYQLDEFGASGESYVDLIKRNAAIIHEALSHE